MVLVTSCRSGTSPVKLTYPKRYLLINCLSFCWSQIWPTWESTHACLCFVILSRGRPVKQTIIKQKIRKKLNVNLNKCNRKRRELLNSIFVNLSHFHEYMFMLTDWPSSSNAWKKSPGVAFNQGHSEEAKKGGGCSIAFSDNISAPNKYFSKNCWRAVGGGGGGGGGRQTFSGHTIFQKLSHSYIVIC